jgi:hypothetical protein
MADEKFLCHGGVELLRSVPLRNAWVCRPHGYCCPNGRLRQPSNPSGFSVRASASTIIFLNNFISRYLQCKTRHTVPLCMGATGPRALRYSCITFQRNRTSWVRYGWLRKQRAEGPEPKFGPYGAKSRVTPPNSEQLGRPLRVTTPSEANATMPSVTRYGCSHTQRYSRRIGILRKTFYKRYFDSGKHIMR